MFQSTINITGNMPNLDTSSSCSWTSLRLLPDFLAMYKIRCWLVSPEIAICNDMVSRNLVFEPWTLFNQYAQSRAAIKIFLKYLYWCRLNISQNSQHFTNYTLSYLVSEKIFTHYIWYMVSQAWLKTKNSVVLSKVI